MIGNGGAVQGHWALLHLHKAVADIVHLHHDELPGLAVEALDEVAQLLALRVTLALLQGHQHEDCHSVTGLLRSHGSSVLGREHENVGAVGEVHGGVVLIGRAGHGHSHSAWA